MIPGHDDNAMSYLSLIQCGCHRKPAAMIRYQRSGQVSGGIYQEDVFKYR